MRNIIGVAFCLILLIFHHIHTQNVICDFENVENDYICTITAANITNDTTPLEFSSPHLERRNDSHVTIVRTNSSFDGRIRIYHPQFTQQFPNLQAIDLQRMGILYLSNNSFDKCDELRKVNLHFNEVNVLQDNLFVKCEKLTELILSSNHLQVLTDNSLNGLDNLEVLNLNFNLINTISDNTFRYTRKLKELYLGNPWTLYQNNKRIFQYLYDLEVIDLSDWHIDFPTTDDFLAGLMNLREIILRKNYYVYFDFESFSRFKNLTVLDLSDNNLLHIMDYSMQNLTNLKEFYIAGNHLEVLSENTFNGIDQLEVLWLGYNSINLIFNETFHNLKNLMELSLMFNKIDELRDGLFQNQQNLKSLHLGVNRITDLPPKVFESLVNLESINIYNNNIQSLNSSAFVKHEFLKNFTASWNKIDRIERNFFENFPNLELVVINENLCVDTIIDDFQKANVSSVFGKCFNNWENPYTTPKPTDIPTTTDGSGNGAIIGFSILLNGLLIIVIFMMQ